MGALTILKYHFYECPFTYSVRLILASHFVLDSTLISLLVHLCGRHNLVGGLAGAAHLLNDNAGVLR